MADVATEAMLGAASAACAATSGATSSGLLPAGVRAAVAQYSGEFDRGFEAFFGPVHALSAGFPFMSPSGVVLTACAYLAFVAVVPLLFRAVGFSLRMKPVMRLYNLFMVVLSAYMGTKALVLASVANDSLFCVPMAEGRAGEEMAQIVWVFTFSKVVEFLDTFFMIMEGRMRQVSFLHVYHHCSILSYWFCITWMMPGSDAYFSVAGNSYIHVLMYSYYLLASFGISPPWKYYITKAQIFQFCLFCVQSVKVGYLSGDSCDFPPILARGLLWYMLTLIALFTHFLVTNKGKRKNKPGAGAKAVESKKAV